MTLATTRSLHDEGGKRSTLAEPSARERVDRRFFLGMVFLTVSGALAQSVNPSRAAESSVAEVKTVEEYRSALTAIASLHKSALIDIGAQWCAFCRTIDGRILPDPAVQNLLKHIGLVKVDVTAMDQSSRNLLRHLRADGPPTLFVVDTSSGMEYRGTRSVGSFKTSDLVRRLRPFAR